MKTRLHFHKYQGTGNDFILVDNREGSMSLTQEQVAQLCHRRFGIGADGLMLLENEPGFQFRMVYFNSDGNPSTMCGNGGRCMVAFAQQLGIVADTAHFLAVDGPHTATVSTDGQVHLHMQDVMDMDIQNGYTILDTGSPHHIAWVPNADGVDVFATGRAIRNEPAYAPNGINVNFTEIKPNAQLYVRTYERGVEDETYSCGTGVTAAAIAASCSSLGNFNTSILTKGGTLNVSFTKTAPHTAENVILSGPATYVFSGEITL